MMPHYKGRKIQEIIKDEEVVGHIYGFNLKPLKYDDEKELEQYISKIKEVIDVEYTSIYIEETLPLEVKKTIEDGLSIIHTDGKDIRIYNIPYIIEALIHKLKRDIIKEEILVLSNNKEECLKIIDPLSNEFSFISVFGLNEIDGEEVYEEILDNTGISVYLPQGNSISLRRYGLIINTVDHLSLTFKDIRKNAVIIDFSETKSFAGVNRYVIEDITIEISNLGFIDNPWINDEISSDLYRCLFKEEYRRFCRIFRDNSWITIDDFINQGNKIKGGY